jgi:hypothetical protein
MSSTTSKLQLTPIVIQRRRIDYAIRLRDLATYLRKPKARQNPARIKELELMIHCSRLLFDLAIDKEEEMNGGHRPAHQQREVSGRTAAH